MGSLSAATLQFLRHAVRAELSPAAVRSFRHSRPSIQPASQSLSPNCKRAYHPSTRLQQAAQSSSATQDNTTLPRQAPDTYYDLFPKTLASGPPPGGAFAIDLKTLRNEFLQLQAKAHPDLHAGEDKRRAEATSALINEAYKTLQDPLRRAQYLLGLHGIETDKDEAAKLGGDAGGDTELLMTVMETNELLEEAESEKDIARLISTNDERVADSVAKLEELFAREELDIARTEAIRLRYWTNIKQSLDEWEPGKPTVLVH